MFGQSLHEVICRTCVKCRARAVRDYVNEEFVKSHRLNVGRISGQTVVRVVPASAAAPAVPFGHKVSTWPQEFTHAEEPSSATARAVPFGHKVSTWPQEFTHAEERSAGMFTAG